MELSTFMPFVSIIEPLRIGRNQGYEDRRTLTDLVESPLLSEMCTIPSVFYQCLYEQLAHVHYYGWGLTKKEIPPIDFNEHASEESLFSYEHTRASILEMMLYNYFYTFRLKPDRLVVLLPHQIYDRYLIQSRDHLEILGIHIIVNSRNTEDCYCFVPAAIKIFIAHDNGRRKIGVICTSPFSILNFRVIDSSRFEKTCQNCAEHDQYNPQCKIGLLCPRYCANVKVKIKQNLEILL